MSGPASSPAIVARVISAAPKQSRLLLSIWRFMSTKYLATFGAFVVLLFFISALLANVIAPYPPNEMHLVDKLDPPSAKYWFGTDHFGRDIFSRVIHGARSSLYVGAGIVLWGTGFAVILGAVTGYFGGKFDMFSQRLVDSVMAIPSIMLLVTIVSILGPSIPNLIFALSINAIATSSRVIRGAVIGVKQNAYFDAGRALGASNYRIITRYVLPNIIAPIIVSATLRLGNAILAESSLSFLGYGVPPPDPTWGGMLSGDGRRYMVTAPWMALAPGLVLTAVVFGIQVFGDGLRDALDPRLRGAR